MNEARLFIGPQGSTPIGPGWVEVGLATADGLVLPDVDFEVEPVRLPHTLKCRAVFTWHGHRLLFGRRHPDSRRVKREYHRRRR